MNQNILKKIEYNNKISREGKDTEGLHSTKRTGEFRIYSKERKKEVHKEILSTYKKLLSETRSETPNVVFMAGIPAAGKTYATKKMFEYHPDKPIATHKETGEKYLILNPDDFKKNLPEYDGGLGAAIVHEESSYLHKYMIKHAIKHQSNVIVDAVMGNAPKAKKQIRKFHEKGYTSKLIHVERDVGEAIDAALDRFKRTGRITPFENIPKSEPMVIDSVNQMKEIFHSYEKVVNKKE